MKYLRVEPLSHALAAQVAMRKGREARILVCERSHDGKAYRACFSAQSAGAIKNARPPWKVLYVIRIRPKRRFPRF